MKTPPVRPLRVLGFWALMFVPLYALNFLLYAYWLASKGSPIIFAALQAVTPLAYLGVSYLYYRKDSASGWLPRLAVMPIWLLLSLIASAVLVLPVYGYDWRSIVNVQVLQDQGPNFAAMLAAAYFVSRKERRVSVPSVPVPAGDDMESLEGPKFE